MLNEERCSISSLSGRIIGIRSASIFIFPTVHGSVLFCRRAVRREDNAERLAIPGRLPLSTSFLDGCLPFIYAEVGIVPGGPLSILFSATRHWMSSGRALDHCLGWLTATACSFVQKPYRTPYWYINCTGLSGFFFFFLREGGLILQNPLINSYSDHYSIKKQTLDL